MKLRGKTPGVFEEPIILPRPDGDLEFIAKAVMDMDEFDKLCPPPKVPAKILPGGEEVENPEDKNYQRDLLLWSRKRSDWTMIKSLTQGTPWLEWEEVDPSDNSTWHLVHKELNESGLSDNEVARLIRGVAIANGIHEGVIQAARESFLAKREAARIQSSSRKVAPSNSPSGKLVSAGK